MKNMKKIILGTFLLVSLQFGLVGCLVGFGGRGGGGWGHDGRWMDGGRGGYGEVHPGGFRR
jgi:hypothetical protein